VLLQLLRGAGPKGLAAMPALKSFAQGIHARPLLGMTRETLQQYANEKLLKWIDDESNNNIKLTRNFIRHDILPTLITRWPSVTHALTRSAKHCAEAQVLLEEFAKDILKNVQGLNSKTLSVNKLLLLDDAKQRLILRTWINMLGFTLPDTLKMEVIRREVLMAGQDRMPCVAWEGVELRRYRDDLYVMPGLAEHDVSFNTSWDIKEPLILNGVGILSATFVEGSGLRADIAQISVGFRQGGEVLRVPGRGRHTLKNLFQEWDIPTWERDRLPLLFADDKCVGVVGHCIDEDYAAKHGEMGFQPHLIPLKRQ
jgi:tRNA(Ile)-lysidine synthase